MTSKTATAVAPAKPAPADARSTLKVVTGKVRASYANVFKPRLNDLNGEEEYSLVLLIPKTDRPTVTAIGRAVEAAIAQKWAGKPPPGLRTPLRDGDAERPGQEGYAGCYFVTAKSKQRPGVVDRALQPVLDPMEFVSGDYCRVSLNAYAYDQKGNRGVAFGLNNLQVLERGEPLTSRARPEDDFGGSAWTDEDEDEAF